MAIAGIPTTTKNDTEPKISGAGAEITALAESLQAYACATRQHLGKPLTNISEITDKTIGDANCDRPLKRCIDELDVNWFYSVITTANQIFDDIPGAKTGKKYVFYRGGRFVDDIYNGWRKFKQGSGITGDDKWNPADIWMVKKGYKHTTDFTTLQDYNAYMFEQFAKFELLGISLKKLGKNSPAHHKIFNAGDPIIAKFTGVKLGSVMTDSKDIYIKYKSGNVDGEVQLRNFSSRPVPSSWQGEIKGKTAAGGKIGGGVIFEGAVSTGIQRSKLTFPNQVPIDRPSDNDFKEFAKMFKELSGSKEKIETLVMQAKVGQKTDKTWWMSKYIGINLVYTVIKEKKIDDLCRYIFQYASSATENSCIFVKYS